MQLVKPNELARVLGISTDALKKRRHRVTKSSNSDTPIGASNFTVTDTGRVLYLFDELPPSVRDNVEKLRKTGTKLTHEQRMKSSFRYANSLGKVNERKKRLYQAEVDKRAKELLEKEKAASSRVSREPLRKENNYIRWVHKHEMTPTWRSIHEPIKKKKNYNYYS